jgi:hypothetical protein
MIPPSNDDETVQLAIRVPKSWVADADTVAETLSRNGHVMTRTDAFRVAMAEGMRMLHAEQEYKYGAPVDPTKTLGPWRFKEDTLELVNAENGRDRYFVDLARMTSSAPTLDAILQVSDKAFLTSSDVGTFVRLLERIVRARQGMGGFVDKKSDPTERLVDATSILRLKKRVTNKKR